MFAQFSAARVKLRRPHFTKNAALTSVVLSLLSSQATRSPGARAQVDAAAGGAAVLGGELAGDDLHLFDGRRRRQEALAGGTAYSNNVTVDRLDNNDDRAAHERERAGLFGRVGRAPRVAQVVAVFGCVSRRLYSRLGFVFRREILSCFVPASETQQAQD